MTAPLEHYGIIGDATTIALVSRSGSIDWMCLPRIDSDACFAQLIGNNQHGYWSLRPAAKVLNVDQHYQPDTVILETDVTCEGGRVRLIDFMPRGTRHDVIRMVIGLEGEVLMHCDLSVRFAYGKLLPWIQRDGNHATLTSGPDALAFESPVGFEPDWDDGRLEASFTVRAGQRLAFSLEYFPSHEQFVRRPMDAEKALEETQAFWLEWAGRCTYQGPLPRSRHALAPHAQGAHARADRRHRRRADDLAPRGAARRAQLGLPLLLAARLDADARRAPARRLSRRGQGVARLADARVRRRAEPDPDHVRRGRSSTASPRSRCRGCPATSSRGRCASATAPTTSSSSTPTARSSTPSTTRASKGCRRIQGRPICCSRSSTSSSVTGSAPTRASGRFAARPTCTSRTRSSWPGSPSIARSASSRSSASARGTSSSSACRAGGRCARRFTTTSSRAPSTSASAPSRSRTDRPRSTPACCSFRTWAFCPPTIRACCRPSPPSRRT